MRWSTRALLGFCSLLGALSCPACKGWRPQQSHDVAGLADPNATYAAVLSTLHAQKYSVIDQDAAAHAVRVRSHVDESDPAHRSVILLQVDGSAVHMSASGYLVHPDGSTHHSLNSELSTLQKQLQRGIASSAPSSAPNVTVATPVPAPALAPALAGPAPAPTSGNLPVSWSEPAYDASVWGHGNFTCLPVKLAADDQAQLTLKLSSGETADVLLSLAYAPELCRAPASCKLPGGCPALGIGDSDRVSKVAGRFSRHEIGPLAKLYAHGKAVAIVDLSKHGSIAQAMTEAKH